MPNCSGLAWPLICLVSSVGVTRGDLMGTPALLFICLKKVKHNHRDSLRNFEKFLFYSIVLLFHGCWVFSYLSEGISSISLNFIQPFSFMYFFSEILFFFFFKSLYWFWFPPFMLNASLK